MAISFLPIRLPPSADATKFGEFGREVKGVHPGDLTSEQFKEIEQALYKHDLLLFRDVDLTPQQQLSLIQAFDPEAWHYAHGNKEVDKTQKSLLHSYLRGLPQVPQVQLIGHGTIHNHEGIPEATLKHGRHPEFHKTRVSEEDEAKGITRFFRWHMDAALYDLPPPKVTALYGLRVPKGPMQVVRYDDGTGDELPVTLGTTAFVSGKIAFDILPREMKSLAIRSRAKYAPHPFQWMRNAKAFSTGLGLENEELETLLDDLPRWEESKVKVYPFLWKNPVTGNLHFQVHPCAITEMLVDPVPEGNRTNGSLYPEGAHLTDLCEIRDLVYRMQRPAITPSLVYPHPWNEKDLVLFNNRGLLHTVVGVFKDDQIRVFHQCNLASPEEPIGPDEQDVRTWA